jgi:hypothetical protein
VEDSDETDDIEELCLAIPWDDMTRNDQVHGVEDIRAVESLPRLAIMVDRVRI